MNESTDAKYRVGVIGCGRAGTTRARAFDLHPLCKVVAIADTDPENLKLGCERFNASGYDTYEKMLRNEAIDIAMPVLPVAPNADAVVASAEVGVKAIFCEKPLTASLRDADRMVEACRIRGITLRRESWFPAIEITKKPTIWFHPVKLERCNESTFMNRTTRAGVTA